MARLLAIAAVLAACGDPPPLTVRFRVTSGDAAACYSTATPPQQVTTCADVMMLCPAVVSIRVVSTDPNDAALPYINVCQELTGQQNLCSIAGVDLSAPIERIPLENLEVQIAVFPLSSVPKDTDTTSSTYGEFLCPQVDFDEVTGFPIAADETCDPTQTTTTCPVLPAVGGRAFYHPGDNETLVDLGCTDLTQLDGAQCAGEKISVNATVDDFDTEVSVQASLADDLTVSIGEPTTSGNHYVLNSVDTTTLSRTVEQPVPAWGADVAATFTASACLEVLENSAETTAALVCQQVDPATLVMTGINGLNGIRLAKTTLSDILGAIGEPDFPESGLVVGIVLDYLGNPVPNINVDLTNPDPDATPTVKYLSSDRHNIIVGGTSSSGIFVSEDAPFGTTFSATSSLHTVNGFGGLVDSKVTVVVLQFSTPVGD